MDAPGTTLAANLRRLREDRGWTQAALADRAQLSRDGYRKIELGESAPRASTVSELARALEVSLAELLRPVPKVTHVRFRSLKRLTSRGKVLADVATWLGDFRQLETVLDEQKPFALEPFLRRNHHGERKPADLARDVRAALELGDRAPIRNICGLLESAGVKVLPIQVANDAFFGLSVGRGDGGPAIVVNTFPRIAVERWIFTAAHELGHLLLHLDAYDVDDAKERLPEEREADSFAAHFLLPEEAFRKEWDASAGMALVDRVFKLKRMFRVSYRTVLYRLSEQYPVGNRIWAMFQVEYHRRVGRTLLKTDEPQGLPPTAFRAAAARAADEPDGLSPADFAEDRLRLLVRRAVEQEHISLGRAGEILGLRLPEMRALAASWSEV